MYRLILTCRIATHEGEIKLAWANGVPEEGREITVGVDGNASLTHRVEGGKKQGNGANGPGLLTGDHLSRNPVGLSVVRYAGCPLFVGRGPETVEREEMPHRRQWAQRFPIADQ